MAKGFSRRFFLAGAAVAPTAAIPLAHAPTNPAVLVKLTESLSGYAHLCNHADVLFRRIEKHGLTPASFLGFMNGDISEGAFQGVELLQNILGRFERFTLTQLQDTATVRQVCEAAPTGEPVAERVMRLSQVAAYAERIFGVGAAVDDITKKLGKSLVAGFVKVSADPEVFSRQTTRDLMRRALDNLAYGGEELLDRCMAACDQYHERQRQLFQIDHEAAAGDPAGEPKEPVEKNQLPEPNAEQDVRRKSIEGKPLTFTTDGTVPAETLKFLQAQGHTIMPPPKVRMAQLTRQFNTKHLQTEILRKAYQAGAVMLTCGWKPYGSFGLPDLERCGGLVFLPHNDHAMQEAALRDLVQQQPKTAAEWQGRFVNYVPDEKGRKDMVEIRTPRTPRASDGPDYKNCRVKVQRRVYAFGDA